jgi:Phage integrase family
MQSGARPARKRRPRCSMPCLTSSFSAASSAVSQSSRARHTSETCARVSSFFARGAFLPWSRFARVTCAGFSPRRQRIARRRPARRGRLRRCAASSVSAWRATTSSELLSSGANLRQIQELLGHKHLDSTQRYTRVNAHQLRGAVRRLPWGASARGADPLSVPGSSSPTT